MNEKQIRVLAKKLEHRMNEFCGSLTPTEAQYLLNVVGAIPTSFHPNQRENVAERIKSGESNSRWYYFAKNNKLIHFFEKYKGDIHVRRHEQPSQ